MKETCPYLFVYGSLRSGFMNPAYQYISTYFDLVSAVSAKGILYENDQVPVAVPTDTDSYIKGELYVIKDLDELPWAMAQLDDYEGLNPEEDETCVYRRDKVNINLNDVVVTAWAYWYSGSTDGLPVIACGDVLEYLAEKKNNG